MRSIAEALKLDPRNFGRTLTANRPSRDTLRRFAATLGVSPIVTRALIEEPFSEDDERVIVAYLEKEVTGASRPLLQDANVTLHSLKTEIATLNKRQRREALGNFLLLQERFFEVFSLTERMAFDASLAQTLVLPLSLIALAQSLRSAGSNFTFKSHVYFKRTRQAREITTAFRWLEMVAPFSEHDMNTIRQVVSKYVPSWNTINIIKPLGAVMEAYFSAETPAKRNGTTQESETSL